MENNQTQQDAPENFKPKKYPFRFSALMIALTVAALVLCAAGFALNTWRFINFLNDGADSAYGWIQYLILYFVSVLLTILLIAMLLKSQYIITEKQLILQLGLIKSKYDIKDIYSMHLFKGCNKLTVYFDDFKNNHAVIVIKDTYYNDFIKDLSERKPSIGFSFSTAEEEDEFTK